MAILTELAAAGTPRYSTTAAALENSAVIVTHQAVFYGCDGRNTDTVNGIFVMVFDAIAVPPNGTLPIVCFGVPPAGTGATIANGNFGYNTACTLGERFLKGIVIAASSTDVSTGFTAIATNKTFFHVDWASEDGLSSS